MSSDYYPDSDEIEIKKKSSGKIEKGVKRLILIAGFILIAQLIWVFGISPFIPFSDVEVRGFAPLNRAEILQIAGLDETSSFISTNARVIQERLSSHILVESAVVMKRFPDRLSLYLNPRKASAVAITSFDSAQIPLFIDREGVFFKTGHLDSGEIINLPVISGIEEPKLGARLPLELMSFMENINRMASSSPELLSAISEIKIEKKTWDGYELVLYPVHSSIRVRIENNLTEDILRYTLLMLNVFNNDPDKPREIDFRSGIGSYLKPTLNGGVREQSL